MHSIDLAAARSIANDTRASGDAVDEAVVAVAHLCANIVAVSKASNMPSMITQGALASTGEGLTRLIATRADMNEAARQMVAIQRRSNLRETAFGCPPLDATGQASVPANAFLDA